MPTDTIFLEGLASSDNNQASLRPDVGTTASSPLNQFDGHRLLLLIGKAQAYYWTRVWQMGEDETLREYATGGGVTFNSPDEAIRYLVDLSRR